MIDKDMTDEQERAEIERILRETQALEAQRQAENAAFQDELRASVLYAYRCPACGHSGHVRRAGDQPEEQANCTACGAAVTAEWDGGVELVPAAPAPKARGGAREGAGRKSKWQAPSTKVMRVPEAYASIVRALIRHLDDTHEVRRGYAPATSERLPIRSLSGRAQYIEFTVSGRDAPREVQDELNL